MLLSTETSDLTQVSHLLKRLRRTHHLSQQQVADLMGVHRTTISNWECQKAWPTWTDIVMLLVDLDYEIVIQERTYPRR